MHIKDQYGIRPCEKPRRRETPYPRESSGVSGQRYYNPETGRWTSRDPIGESHLGGGSACQAIYDDGVIKDDDLDVCPELPNPETGQSYSECTPIKLSPCEYDVKQFEQCVCAFNEPGYSPDYIMLGWNCSSFANNAISHCMEQAKKTTCK